MNNLFYIGTFEDKIKLLKHDLKQEAKLKGIALPKTFHIVNGSTENIGKAVLLIIDPPTDKFFSTQETSKLKVILDKYKIDKRFIIHCYPFPKPVITKEDIKKFSPWVKTLTNIIEPVLIVTLGENAQLVFSKRKSLLKENHGTVTEHHNGIKVITTYPIEYYDSRSEFEDMTYKLHILDYDWSIIKKEYEVNK